MVESPHRGLEVERTPAADDHRLMIVMGLADSGGGDPRPEAHTRTSQTHRPEPEQHAAAECQWRPLITKRQRMLRPR
jgi:hypothetical protein